MKILIAADGSKYTKRKLAFIAAHDEWLSTQHTYTVLHCVPAIPHRAAAFVGKDQVRAFYEADVAAVFKFADRNRVDPIVLGTHGCGAIGGLVMGSVATKILSLCASPVLLVR